MFEHYRKPLISRRAYRRRIVGASLLALGLIAFSLFAGMAGYRVLEGQPWIDAFLSASMILSGMGPVSEPRTDVGKLFAGAYALFSGFVALISVGVLAAPVMHRFLHKFHMEAYEDDEDDGNPGDVDDSN
jgi:hypothetical protein